MHHPLQRHKQLRCCLSFFLPHSVLWRLLALPGQRWPLESEGHISQFLSIVLHPPPGPWQTAPVHLTRNAAGPLAPFTLVTQQLSVIQCFLDTLGLIWIWPADLEVKGSTVCYQFLEPVHSPREASKCILPTHRKISYYNPLSFPELRNLSMRVESCKDLMNYCHWVKNPAATLPIPPFLSFNLKTTREMWVE